MWLFGVAVMLLSAGVVMVYSASAVVAADRFGDPYFFLKKQLFWALLGSVGMLVAVRVDYRRLERFVLPALVLAGVLLVLVLIPPIGQAINGTRRWIRLGPVSFQPAELAKVALVFYLAAFVARRQEEVADVRRGILPPLLVAGSFAALVLVQPDLGNCLTLVALTFGLLYLAGSPVRYLAWAMAPALPLLVLAIYAAPYRLRRVTAFWDPWADPRGSGFQIIQSWLAFGNGGLVGQGIGGSRQKLFYLPESHTDFIFAVVGEELGFLGAAAFVALFAVLVWRGLRVGLRTSEPFGAYLALGITLLIATQTLVNLGVVTGLLPTKGLPLPFISFGGSALSMTMLSTGVLLNISQHAHV
ncbi:MAG: putative lipid II flippase FtsW [Candidatus Rokuibacteriota bacterium]|nr:MAG: putative lipid II flippase FtsW [Candidatus Rokubacteria bacterium]